MKPLFVFLLFGSLHIQAQILNAYAKATGINGANTIILNGNTLTINNAVKGTGTFTGSATSNIIVADQAGTLNFAQTSLATRSLNTLTLNAKASATIGIGLLDIFGGLTLPVSSSLTVKSAMMLVH